MNLVAVIGQFFVVSRVLKYLGVGSALLILPVVSMGGAVAIVLFPALALIRMAKIAEKGVEYSLETTAVNALYLVVSRDDKYKAKAVIDTLTPGRAVLHMEFTPRGEAVWLSSRDDNKVVVVDTDSRRTLAELPAEHPSGIFFTSRAVRIGF